MKSLSDREQAISLPELNACLQILERAEQLPLDSEDSSYPLPVRNRSSPPFMQRLMFLSFSQNSTRFHRTFLPPHFTTPRWETEAQRSRPSHWPKRTRMDMSLIYLVAALIAIPNVALSWAPMNISVIIGSAIAVLYGYRLAIAFPFLMLLNPASPIWTPSGGRMKRIDVSLLSPHHSPPSRKHCPHLLYSARRLSPHTRRHSPL